VSQPGAKNVETVVQYDNSTSCLPNRPPESRESLLSEFGSPVFEQPQKKRDSCRGVDRGEPSLIIRSNPRRKWATD
jgi:hypothetical protein